MAGGGILDWTTPKPGLLGGMGGAAPMSGPLFGPNGRFAQFRQQNPQAWNAMAAGLLAGPTLGQGMARAAAGFGQASQADVMTREDMARKTALNNLLKSPRFKSLSPEERAYYVARPEAFDSYVQSMGAVPKAPETRTVYENGLPVVKQWIDGKWETLGGPKAPEGMSIEYTPDGGFRMVQGEGVGGALPGNQPLSRTTTSDIQKDIDDLETQRDQVERIGKLYDPELLTWWGKARGTWAEVADKAGMAGPNDKAFLDKQTRFTQNVEQVFNMYRKDITGAAAAVAELERLKKSVINTDQSPAQFEASLGEFARALERGLGIKTQLLREGIPLGSPQFSAEFERRFLSGSGTGGGGVAPPPSGPPGMAPAAPAGPAPVYTSPTGVKVFAE